jgi:ketopantoate hydroxymethyltransferase
MIEKRQLFKYLNTQRRYSPSIPRLKINIYRDYEVEGVAQAFYKIKDNRNYCPVECLMVADSYLMTHMGQKSTVLSSRKEQDKFFKIMLDLVREVSGATDRTFQPEDKPFILGDMPDGSTDTVSIAVESGIQMVEAGADAVKLEIDNENKYEIIDALTQEKILVIAHIGYTPQKGKNQSYGDTFDEAEKIIEVAGRVKEIGGCGLVLERINETVNQFLCIPKNGALPIYSIFSGKANYGGQSLNVWDSVIKPDFDSSFFPPTATYTRDNYKEFYTVQQVSQSMEQLIQMTMDQKYPKSPKSRLLQEDINQLISIMNPWTLDCSLDIGRS